MLVSAPDLRSGLNVVRWVAVSQLLLLASDLETTWSGLILEETVALCSLFSPVSVTRNCATSDEVDVTRGTGEGDVTRPRVQSLLW